jgi:hypothetical protein
MTLRHHELIFEIKKFGSTLELRPMLPAFPSTTG